MSKRPDLTNFEAFEEWFICHLGNKTPRPMHYVYDLLCALDADRERLDWLQHHSASLHCNYVHPNDWSVTVDDFQRDPVVSTADTIRAAIDTAKDNK